MVLFSYGQRGFFISSLNWDYNHFEWVATCKFATVVWKQLGNRMNNGRTYCTYDAWYAVRGSMHGGGVEWSQEVATSGLMKSEKNRIEFLMISGRSTRCDLHPQLAVLLCFSISMAMILYFTTNQTNKICNHSLKETSRNYCVSIHAAHWQSHNNVRTSSGEEPNVRACIMQRQGRGQFQFGTKQACEVKQSKQSSHQVQYKMWGQWVHRAVQCKTEWPSKVSLFRKGNVVYPRTWRPKYILCM
jgi:hypothetical protein